MAMKRRRSTKRKASNLPTSQAKWLEEEEEGICEASDIGKDVLFEILVRLPIKCLLRFKTVSKYWFRLISSREFIKFRLQYACDDPGYTHHRILDIERYYVVIFRQASLLPTLGDPEAFYRPETPLLPLPMEFLEEESYAYTLKFVGSCSGMVCIASVDNRVIVWNPALRKCKRLPYFGRGDDVFYGFGYDESSDDFKVVGIRNTPKTLVKIYSAKTDSWKKLQEDGFEVGSVDSHGCFLNGKLHWATENKTIFSIDVSSERFGVMEPPDSVHQEECRAWSVYAVGEFLSVFCFYTERSTRDESSRWILDADFFIMERYGVKETWRRVNNGATRLRVYDYVCKEGHMNHHYIYVAPSGPGEVWRTIPIPGHMNHHYIYVAPSGLGEAWRTIPIPGHMTSNAIKAFLLYSFKGAGDYPFDNQREFFTHFHPERQQVTVYVESLIWPFLSVSR